MIIQFNNNIPTYMQAPIDTKGKTAEEKATLAVSREWDVVVAGAGYAGCVVARTLAKAGFKVAIIEQKEFVGGHAHDYYDENGALVHKYGPHIFHTNNKKIFEFISEFTNWRFYQHRVKSSLNGQLYDMPINKNTINKLYNLNLDEKGVKEYLESVKVPIAEIKNSEDVVLSQVGSDLCEKFFRNYTKKQWGGLDLKDLSPDVLKRIPTRTNEDDRYFTDPYQLMPLEGYTAMLTNMINHPNISTFLGVDYLAVKDQIKTKHTVFTGPIDAYYNHQFGPLPYRSVGFEFQYHKDKEWYQDVGTVNYPNDFAFTRITEFKHLTGQKMEGTVIIKEYPKDVKDTKEPFYPVLCAENDERYKKYRELADKEVAVTFVGRLAEFKYYNMDQVTESALASAENLVKRLKTAQ